MTDPLLTTKLQLPILRKDAIPRGRLIERLSTDLWQENGFVRKLTLVSAPAGFGKTTLVSEWLSALTFAPSQSNPLGPPSLGDKLGEAPNGGVRAAWLSLDDSDNDPVRFLTYIIAALRQIQPEFGRQTQAIMQLPQPPPPPVVLTSLVNELSILPAPVILALDDYHAIHTPPIHQQLVFILDHQPPNLHLVILTREDPLLPVARLRARGQLLEIRQQDLRFTNAETAEFLKQGTGLSLTSDDISALERHTEGWAAGLQLAVLSLRGCDNSSAFIRDFTASDRYVLDYLMEEVFERQPIEVQDFLLRTSILKRLSGPLCDAVVEYNTSAGMLHSLEQSNLFIVPLDPAHNWYRYHHLFAELLQHRLRLSGIAESGLHQRASRWYETQELLPEAIEHALLAQDWGNAARLIGVVNEGMFKRGEYVTLLGWCDRLPREIIHASPNLCLIHAWAALMISQLEAAAPLLERAEQMSPPGSALLGQVASAQAFLARSQRNNARAIEKSEQALSLLPETDITTRGMLAMNLGLAYWHVGELAKAEPVLLQAIDLCTRVGNRFALLTAQIFLARVFASRGKLHQALEMDEGFIRAGGQIPILCLAHFDLATIYYEWNNLPKAMQHLEQGATLAERSGNLEFQQAGHLLRAVLLHALDDEAGALAALSEAEMLARDFPPVIRSRAAAFGVHMALARNHPQMLAQWEPQVDADVDAHLFYRFMGLTKARLLLAKGQKAEAAEVLAKTYEMASCSGWGYGALVTQILQGLAAKSPDVGLAYLTEALHTGRREGFIRSFTDAGAGISPMLQEAARRDIEIEYVGQILAALRVDKRNQPQNLVEPLSEREIEVLRLVTAGLSNREIALKLVISPGTAKTHIHHLCGKLGARNRTEAAMKAKELQLV